MNRTKQSLCAFAIGAASYSLIEMAFRGRTHWTMALTGGACFAAIYNLNRRLRRRRAWVKCLLGAGLITAAELAVGLWVNRLMKWQVWDYSNQFLNLFGQICPLFSLGWFLLCVPLVPLSNWLCAWWERDKARPDTVIRAGQTLQR